MRYVVDFKLILRLPTTINEQSNMCMLFYSTETVVIITL